MLRRIPARYASTVTPTSTTMAPAALEGVLRELDLSSPAWLTVEQYLSDALTLGTTAHLHEVQQRVFRLYPNTPTTTNTPNNPISTIGSNGTNGSNGSNVSNGQKVPPVIYQLLIHACCANKSPADAISLYLQAAHTYTTKSDQNTPEKRLSIDKFNHERMINYLLMAVATSHAFTDLFALKILWENYIYPNTRTANSELLYFAAHINVLLNTGQVEMALELFKQTVSTLDSAAGLPTIRLLDLLAADGNCTEMCTILALITQNPNESIQKDKNNVREIDSSRWIAYLSVGLQHNHYELVALIYHRFVMRAYNGAITTEMALFDSLSAHSVVDSLTDELLMQILHTLAVHGDVALSLALIESHYIHREMKGERALTKELCVCIVHAYCHAEQAAGTPALLAAEDHSVERVIDVLNGFVKKLEKERKQPISYRDISGAMSFRFRNYTVFDKNVEARAQQLAGTGTASPPSTNRNLESSVQGNVLANLDTLTSFLIRHVEYLDSIGASPATTTLFVNCVLNHANIYQNLSGIIRILTSLHKQNPRMFTEWLDADLMDIILNSVSKSSAAKQVSFELFEHMRASGTVVTKRHYLHLISAVLRDDYHECLQAYLYHCLRDHHCIDESIAELLGHIPAAAVNMNPKTKLLIEMATSTQHMSEDEVDEYWRVNGLVTDKPLHISGRLMPELNRKYYKQIDLRDVKYLKYVLHS